MIFCMKIDLLTMSHSNIAAILAKCFNISSNNPIPLHPKYLILTNFPLYLFHINTLHSIKFILNLLNILNLNLNR